MRKPKSSFSSLKKCSDAWTDPFVALREAVEVVEIQRDRSWIVMFRRAFWLLLSILGLSASSIVAEESGVVMLDELVAKSRSILVYKIERGKMHRLWALNEGASPRVRPNIAPNLTKGYYVAFLFKNGGASTQVFPNEKFVARRHPESFPELRFSDLFLRLYTYEFELHKKTDLNRKGQATEK